MANIFDPIDDTYQIGRVAPRGSLYVAHAFVFESGRKRGERFLGEFPDERDANAAVVDAYISDPQAEQCPDCEGRKRNDDDTDECGMCAGTGKVFTGPPHQA